MATLALRVFFIWCLVLTALVVRAQMRTPTDLMPPTPPNAHAFRGWQPVEGYADSSVNLATLDRVEINCPADPDSLYPTHPQQDSKIYHRFDWGGYDNTKLKGDDEACAMSSKYKGSDGQFACLRPDVAYFVIMSDIYRDRCGNMYRAYWKFLFLKKNENMGTLFSLGRTMYPRPNSKVPGDYVLGGTYKVSRAQMVFLSPPLAGEGLYGDLGKATELRARALKAGVVFDEKSLLFIIR